MDSITDPLDQTEKQATDVVTSNSGTTKMIVLLVFVIMIMMNTYMQHDLNNNKYRFKSDYGTALVYTGILMSLGLILCMFNNRNLVRLGAAAVWIAALMNFLLIPSSFTYFDIYNKKTEGKKFLYLRPDGEVAGAVNILVLVLIPISIATGATLQAAGTAN